MDNIMPGALQTSPMVFGSNTLTSLGRHYYAMHAPFCRCILYKSYIYLKGIRG